MKTRKMVHTKKILTAFTAFALFASASAQPLSTTAKSLPGEPLSVKYLGADDDYLLFQVTIQTNDVVHPVLHIADKNAGELYAETIKSNSIIENIKIEKNENQDLSFELVEGKKTYCKSFTFNTSMIEKTTVSEGDEVVTRY